MITGFPEGYDTKIAGLGRNLSGGQRQLVGLARAIFGAPRIVVLDEPDASLDQQAEASLLGLIDRVRQERNFSLLIISHSPRIIDRMDRLLLVRDGTVATMMRQTPSAPQTISELHPGQAVEVEFSGLNRRATPIVPGKVMSISADLLTDPANPQIRYFNAKIEMSNVKLDVPLTAGMPVVAYIRTHERTPLEMWLDPVVGALRHSLRER